VREPDELARGQIPFAINIPRGVIELKIEDLCPDDQEKIVFFCGGGNRSALAALSIQQMGYPNVLSLRGGYGAWKQEGFPIKE